MLLKRIVALSALTGALALSSAGIVQAQTIELKFSHFVPPNHTFHKWAQAWTQRLEKESGGRLKFTIYPNGQLVGPPGRQFDAARNGVVDIAFTLHGATAGRYPMSEIANLPFTWPKAGSDSMTTSVRFTELGPKYLAGEHPGLHVLFMPVANPIVAFSRVPIKSIGDFKGLKIRYAGTQNKYLVDALGAAGLPIPAPEAQDALAKGIVDAAVFPYEAGVAYDLSTVSKHVIEPPLATATFAVVMNKAKYDGLPADLKAMIDKASGVAAAKEFGQAWADAEQAGKKNLLGKGMQLSTLSDADIAEVKKRMAPHVEAALAALEKDGKPARAFYNEYIK